MHCLLVDFVRHTFQHTTFSMPLNTESLKKIIIIILEYSFEVLNFKINL